MTKPPVKYKRRRCSPGIIARAVWRYFRFPLGLRLVEEMLLERAIVVSCETVRRRAMKFEVKFGVGSVSRLRRKTPGQRDVWHLDGGVVSMKARNAISGGPSIRTAMSLTKSSRSSGTPRPPGACRRGFQENRAAFPGASSLPSPAPAPPQCAPSRPVLNIALTRV